MFARRLLQRRGCRALADEMRAAGVDETVAFHTERKEALAQEYHFPESRAARGETPLDRRLEVYKQAYEAQEMDGRCRWAFSRELEAVEQQIYKMAVRSGRRMADQHLLVHNKLRDAKARLTRRYRGLDADLRSGDPHLERRAVDYLRRVELGDADRRWDHAEAAHRRYAAELQGSPAEERDAAARAEMDGAPDASPDVLETLEQTGLLQTEEFGVLRREVGEEAADEFIAKLHKARVELVQKRMDKIKRYTRLHQLEKRLILQDLAEYRTPEGGREFRQGKAAEVLSRAEASSAQWEDFMNERVLSGHGDFNAELHERYADVRKKRAQLLKEKRAQRAAAGGAEGAEGPQRPEERERVWDSTAGLVESPRHFVDPDWWELASVSPAARRHYTQAYRRDVRTAVNSQKMPQVVKEKETADRMLDMMDSFADFRKNNFARGYSRSQVLAYDDPNTMEPRNPHVELAEGKTIFGQPVAEPDGYGASHRVLSDRLSYRQMIRDAQREEAAAGRAPANERPHTHVPHY